jgi:type II secretory pathway component PulC
MPRYREAKNGEKTNVGFEISRIRESSIVEQLGLKNGDVILAANGEPLDSLATVMRLFARIRNETPVKLTVLRGGQRRSFVFNRK